jgi:hypothetical protein
MVKPSRRSSIVSVLCPALIMFLLIVQRRPHGGYFYAGVGAGILTGIAVIAFRRWRSGSC